MMDGATTTAKHRGPLVARPLTPRMQLARNLYAGGALLVPLAGVVLACGWSLLHGLTWSAIPLLVLMHVATELGITLGYHRYLSHRAFVPRPALEVILLALAAMAGQGPPLRWAADHRRHHHFSDRPGDPHSPHHDGERRLRGFSAFWHAHAGWTFGSHLTNPLYYCPDLLRMPRVRFFNRAYPWLVVLGLALPAALGYALEGTLVSAVSGLLWGGLARLALTYHCTFAVNSLAHLSGKRPFATGDMSRNVGWLAILTMGEGWHNNHHAAPGSAFFAVERWQIDVGGLCLSLLSRMGLVSELKSRRTQRGAG